MSAKPSNPIETARGLKIHPVSEIFPLLQGEDLQALAEDIRINGLREPVVVQHDVLLDGRNRLAACEIAGVAPTFREYDGNRPVAFIVGANLHRRHLEKSQKIALALELEPHLAREARERQAHGKTAPGKSLVGKCPTSVPRSRDIIAATVGLSGKTVSAVKSIRKSSPERFERIKAGELSVAAAKREIQAEANKAALEEARARIDEERRTNLAAVCDLRTCSCVELFASGIKPDAVITDPPYPEQFLPVYSELAESCAQSGVPLVAVMVGQSYLPEVMRRLCEHLRYRWTLAYLTPGGQAVQQWQSKVNSAWKPVLLFGESAEWLGDVASSKPNDNDKRFHHWGQSESGMADLVDRLTRPGQLVCDPFLGGGTTAVVSLAMGRRFVGCDVDPACVEQSRLRVEVSHA